MATQFYTNHNDPTQAQKQFIKKHGEVGKALLEEFELKYAKEAIEENYLGEYRSKEDFAKNYMKDRADDLLPQGSFEYSCLSLWLDWDHITWQLMMDFTAIEVNGMTHVFYAF